MLRPASFMFLAVALVCGVSLACSSAPTDRVGQDGKPVAGDLKPNDPNGVPPNPNHDEGDPDPQDDQGEQPDQPGPKCDVMPAPIPDGWKVYASTTFTVAVPSTGYSRAPDALPLIEFHSDPIGTTLGASVRTDGKTLAEAVDIATFTLNGKSGHNCTVTTEATTYLCDDAVRIHATCVNQFTIEAMLVMHAGQVYSMMCSMNPMGDKTACMPFLTTLRFE